MIRARHILMRVFLAACSVVLAPLQSSASNFHEHMSTIGSFEDFEYAFKKVGRPLFMLKMSDISRRPGQNIYDIFGVEVATTLASHLEIDLRAAQNSSPAPLTNAQRFEPLDKVLENLTVGRVCELTAKAINEIEPTTDAVPDDVLRSLYEFTPLNRHTDKAYIAMGWGIRANSQSYLMGPGLYHLFESFARSTPVEDRRVLTVTVNGHHSFDTPEHARIMKQIKNLMAANGTSIEWLAGFSRRFIEHSKFDEDLQEIRAYLSTQNAQGLDITGSILENIERSPLNAAKNEKYVDRLSRLILTLTDENHSLPLKVHMYESRAEGLFYALFFQALERIGEMKKRFPPIIRIGHISALREQDIQRFVELRDRLGIRFAFEASLDSNIYLQISDPRLLALRINQLVENGFDVRLGTDGLGIFGPNSLYRSALDRLKKAGLTDKAEKHIHEGSQHLNFDGDCEYQLTYDSLQKSG